MASSSSRLSLADIAAVSVAGLTAVQLLTDANPVGRCLLFLKQLRGHVSETNSEFQQKLDLTR